MSPRRGGGGSRGSGGGVDCPNCDEDLALSSVNYTGVGPLAILVFSFLVFIVAVTTFVMVLRKPWLNPNGKRDKSAFWTFAIAALATICGQIIVIADHILHVEEATVTYSYYIVYIFSNLFSRLAEVAIYLLAITSVDAIYKKWHGKERSIIRIVNNCVWIVLVGLTLVGWGYYVRFVVLILTRGDFLAPAYNKIVAGLLTSLSFLLSIELLLLSVWMFVKKAVRGKHGIVLLTLTGSLFTYGLMSTIFVPQIIRNTIDTQGSLFYAYRFITFICYIAIFIALAMLSRQDNKFVLQTLTDNIHGSDKISSMALQSGKYGKLSSNNDQNEFSDQPSAPLYSSKMAYNQYDGPNQHDSTQPLTGTTQPPPWQPQSDYQTQQYFSASNAPSHHNNYAMPVAPEQAQMQQQRFYQGGGGGAYASVPQHQQ